MLHRLHLEIRLEDVLAVTQVLEAVGFERENLVEVFFGKDRVIDRAVVFRVSVRVRAGALERVVVLLRRDMLCAAKHQVLEQVREARLARLDFVARPGGDDDVERDDVRVIGRHGDDAQAIRQVVHEILVRENLAVGGCG